MGVAYLVMDFSLCGFCTKITLWCKWCIIVEVTEETDSFIMDAAVEAV